MLYTFDVFDTLITRTTATPKGIFALMQDTLINSKDYCSISEYIRHNFFQLRVNAEEMARGHYRLIGYEDITLEQIYEVIAQTGCLTADERDQLMCLEKEVEYENVIAITSNITQVKSLLAQGQRIALISDMYLDAATIRKMLIKADSVFENIRLYMSSEYKKGKSSGKLFGVVKEMEAADFNEWIHCGDNLSADVKSPRRLGIQVRHYALAGLIDCEKTILAYREQDTFTQLTIGAAKNARWQYELADAATIGCSIGGVILFPYIWWVLQKSMANKIKRLYFVARDGYVLKKIADSIIEKFDYPIETYYIYGSRRAWRMASFGVSRPNMDWMLEHSHLNNVRNVKALANIFQITVEELNQFLPFRLEGDNILTPQVVSSLRRRLASDESFHQYLYDAHKENGQRVAAYLKQEINVGNHDFAFVELSGTGFTQQCMASIMSSFYDGIVTTFFLQLSSIHDREKQRHWCFIPNALRLNFIVELLCRAPHGQTIGYEKDETGKFIPVFGEDEGNILIEQYGFDQYMMGIELFTESYVALIDQMGLRADNTHLLLQYLEYISKTPDSKVLSYFGDMPFGVTGRENTVVKFAPKLSLQELREIFLLRTTEPIEEYYKGVRLDYSLLRCTKSDLEKIEFYKACHDSQFGRLARSAWQTKGQKSNYPYLAYGFPCNVLSGRIVIYGAGKMGKELYQKIEISKQAYVVQWVDQNFKKCQEQGLKVSHPDDIGQVEYDQVVIAVLDMRLAESIRNHLIQRGIADEKIVWWGSIFK